VITLAHPPRHHMPGADVSGVLYWHGPSDRRPG
jgi:hypothetical protein